MGGEGGNGVGENKVEAYNHNKRGGGKGINRYDSTDEI